MYFDIAMPLTLFAVTLVAMFLNGKVENKLKGVLEEKEFRVKDAIMLVAAISITISLVVFIPEMAIMTIFLFAYSMLLFTFTYVFSDFQRTKARLFFSAFLAISFITTIFTLYILEANTMIAYGSIVFFCLFGFAFLAFIYDEQRAVTKERWYLAVLPAALFICLYIFFNNTRLWFPYLINLYGLVFAVLIILYLGSLFTWKTTLIFAGLLTIMDIILVLGTGTMVSAASHVSELRLPVLIMLPTIPQIATQYGILYMSLGLGDFFFAGLLAIQTLKKFGKKPAIVSIIVMTFSFFVFEALLLNYKLRAFPGTLMIIVGWLPILGWAYAKHRKSKF